MSFLETLINGISLGSVYAIIALGYTMVYGIAKMLNFAHGDVIMVGGFACFFMTSSSALDLHPALGVLVAVVVCTALGILIERMAYKPLRQAPSLAVLITAIGVSYFLQNGMLLLLMKALKRSQKVSFPKLFGDKSFNFGEITISVTTIVTIAACVVIMLALTWFTSRTKMGKAMRACSEDKAAAQLMGINVNTTISVTFAIGSALAAIAGVLMCTAYPNLEPTTGAMPGIKAFTAAVIGGIGSIPGAMLGGILLGMVECISYKITAIAPYTDAIEFSILIIILLVRPTGFLGKKRREKV